MDPVVVVAAHAASDFHVERRHPRERAPLLRVWQLRVAKEVREGLRRRRHVVGPEDVGIAREEGQEGDLPRCSGGRARGRHRGRPGPPGPREGDGREASSEGDLSQGQQVFPVAGLVLELAEHHRPTLVPPQPVELLGELCIQPSDVMQVPRVPGAQLDVVIASLGDDPIRVAPVADVAVVPWSSSDHDPEANLCRGAHEPAKVSAASKVELALDFLVVDPE